MTDKEPLGLVRCDAPGCGWITKDRVPLHEWAESKCPDCGAELMDASDRVLLSIVRFLFRLGLASNGDPKSPKPGQLSIDTDRRPR